MGNDSEDPGKGLAPPYDIDAEAAVLSVILIVGDGRAVDLVAPFLRPEHFYPEAHRRIYEVMLFLHANGKPCDELAVASQLLTTDRLKQIGGRSYLTEIIDSVPAINDVAMMNYARIVFSKWRLRELQARCRLLIAESYFDVGDVQTFLDSAEDRIHSLARASSSASFETFDAVAKRVVRELGEARRDQAQGGKPTWKRTGLVDFDKVMLNIRPGTLTILAARPSVGKSAFAFNHIAMPVAKDDNEDVAFIGLEMSNDDIAERGVAHGASVRGEAIAMRETTDADTRRLISFLQTAHEYRIHLCDNPSVTTFEMRALLRRLKSEVERQGRRLGLAIVDYLQLMNAATSAGKRRNSSRQEDVAELSRSLKQLSKELNIPIVALSQLNRAIENRSGADARPRLSDLRESGAIEQDADNVIFIHRDTTKGEAGDNNVAELIIAKQRKGKKGVVAVRFTGEYTRFENLERNEWGDQ